MARDEDFKVFHQHLPANTQGRDLFLGDVHGRLDKLFLALDEVAFNPQTDRIISVGDLIDRGPNSYELLKLTREPWFFSVRGNHETMFVGTDNHFSFVHWLINGGDWFNDLSGEAIIDSYTLAYNLPTAITVDTPDGAQIGVCHAEWPKDNWADIETHLTNRKTVSTMLWSRKTITEKTQKWDKSAILTVHGHTPVDEVKKLGTALFIDTGCAHGGKLTLIDRKEALNWPLNR